VNVTLLMSLTVPSVNQVTRILAVVVTGPVSTQLNVPVAFAVFTAEAAIV
jgi:hypothetical protein